MSFCFLMNSCAYQPISRKFTRFTSDICDRKDFSDRLCSDSVRFFSFPIYLITLGLDIPLGVIEFISGYQPFKDPLLSFHVFPGFKNQEYWIVKRISSNKWQLTHLMDNGNDTWIFRFEPTRLTHRVPYRSEDLTLTFLSKQHPDNYRFLNSPLAP